MCTILTFSILLSIFFFSENFSFTFSDVVFPSLSPAVGLLPLSYLHSTVQDYLYKSCQTCPSVYLFFIILSGWLGLILHAALAVSLVLGSQNRECNCLISVSSTTSHCIGGINSRPTLTVTPISR